MWVKEDKKVENAFECFLQYKEDAKIHSSDCKFVSVIVIINHPFSSWM